LVGLNNGSSVVLNTLKEATASKIARMENDEKRHNEDRNTFSTNNF
jgi:hypothetical protein